MINPQQLFSQFDLSTASIVGRPKVERHLSDLQGVFWDSVAFQTALGRDNPLIYSVTTLDYNTSVGDLHCGLGMLRPGKIGREYYCTKGHLHSWREAAEFYIGLAGEGFLLLENEQSRQSQLVPISSNTIVYVPGQTAHRTINTGSVPLLYLGIYSAKAGHDYEAIRKSNFRHVVVETNGKPELLDRTEIFGVVASGTL